jgi:hemolysin activation/secretion protein
MQTPYVVNRALPKNPRLRIFVKLFFVVFFLESATAQTNPPTSAGVRVRAFKITGNDVLATSFLEPILAPYVDKELDLTQLQAIADLITEEYRRHGYALARAYIPQQEITEGEVEIAVLEGRLGAIEVRGNQSYSAGFVKGYFAPLIEEKAIKQSSLERSLLILNDFRDLRATAFLQAGKEPGTTDIIVNVEGKLPLHLALDYNNFGSTTVSRNRFGAEIEVAKFLPIEGSSLSIRGVMGSKASDFLYGRTAFTLPVNKYGTKLGLSVSGGNFDVGQEFADLDITGKSWDYVIALSHPFIKTRFQSLTAEFGFESKDADQFLLDTLSSRDKIRMLKAGIDFNSTDGSGGNVVSFSINQGLGHTLGAMQNNDPNSSRVHADNRFTRFSLNAARFQRLTDYLAVLLRGSGQVTTRSLVATEQFSIGGFDTVRGYPQGEVLGDHGYNLSAEFRLSPLPNRDILQLAFFVDHGAAAIREAPAGTRSYATLTGVGYGLRLNYSYRSLNFNGRFDVGFPVRPSKSSTEERPMPYIQAILSF